MIRRAVIHQVGEFAPFSTAAVNARKPLAVVSQLAVKSLP
jgi:hypothetical protein